MLGFKLTLAIGIALEIVYAICIGALFKELVEMFMEDDYDD